MLKLLAVLVTAFIVTFFLIPIIIKIFKKKNLFDKPGGRKIHKVVTPSMGGIAIFSGMALAILIWMPFDGFPKYNFLYSALIIMFITGVRDDLVPLKPTFKLAAQILAAIMIIVLNDIRISSFYGFLGIHEIHPWISYAISLFVIIIVTNAYNLIDGIDGLAGSIAITTLAIFGLWFFATGRPMFCIVIFSLIGALLAFLRFNWEPARIFMGDTGALLIGFMLAALAISMMEHNQKVSQDSLYHLKAPISTVIAILIIPLYDTLRIIILRLRKGQSPMSPDKSHIHHFLMRLGLRHSESALTLTATNLIFITVVVFLQSLGDHILLPILGLMMFLFGYIIDTLIARKYSIKRFEKRFSKRGVR